MKITKREYHNISTELDLLKVILKSNTDYYQKDLLEFFINRQAYLSKLKEEIDFLILFHSVIEC